MFNNCYYKFYFVDFLYYFYFIFKNNVLKSKFINIKNLFPAHYKKSAERRRYS